MSITAVNSFVIRFKQEQEMDQPLPSWHGSIRHVQTSQEIHFTQIGDALGFMAQFVEIEEADQEAGKQQTQSANQSHA